jgi:hypothetical protein
MANTNAPFGFRQTSGTGSAPTYEQVTMRVAYNNTTPIYFGDAVIPLSTGYIAQATASTVQVAGIFVGCKYLSTSQKRIVWSNYWPGSDVASTAPDVEAYIVNDPNAKFLVQAGGTAVGVAAINANIQLNVGTGNAANGISGMYVETPNTTATLPFRVVALVTDPPGANGTDIASAYNQIIVAFNYASTRTTDGV